MCPQVVQVLRTQLQEQSELHEQRQQVHTPSLSYFIFNFSVSALHLHAPQAATEDRLINQTEHAEALARAAQNNNELMAEHTRLQDLHRVSTFKYIHSSHLTTHCSMCVVRQATTKDYMLLRHASQATERMLREVCESFCIVFVMRCSAAAGGGGAKRTASAG